MTFHDQPTVSIPQWCDCCTEEEAVASAEELGFNPTMVRLLQVPNNLRSLAVPFCFNPTMVRLLPNSAMTNSAMTKCFNPTMVRLLLQRYLLFLSEFSCFNPTMVRLLPTLRPSCHPNQNRFNPTMVRLLPTGRKQDVHLPFVSIPQWCDCCLGWLRWCRCWCCVSIPQWCDCCGKREFVVSEVVSRVSIPQWCDCCSTTRGSY